MFELLKTLHLLLSSKTISISSQLHLLTMYTFIVADSSFRICVSRCLNHSNTNSMLSRFTWKRLAIINLNPEHMDLQFCFRSLLPNVLPESSIYRVSAQRGTYYKTDGSVLQLLRQPKFITTTVKSKTQSTLRDYQVSGIKRSKHVPPNHNFHKDFKFQ